MNKITATGRLAADAEIRYTSNGNAVASFRMASDVGFGDHKTTNWFACSIWGKRAESITQYLAKGTPVTVFGTLTMREWTDKQGAKQLSPDIRVDEIELHGKKAPEAPQEAPAQTSGGGFEDSDIPF